MFELNDIFAITIIWLIGVLFGCLACIVSIEVTKLPNDCILFEDTIWCKEEVEK